MHVNRAIVLLFMLLPGGSAAVKTQQAAALSSTDWTRWMNFVLDNHTSHMYMLLMQFGWNRVAAHATTQFWWNWVVGTCHQPVWVKSAGGHMTPPSLAEIEFV